MRLMGKLFMLLGISLTIFTSACFGKAVLLVTETPDDYFTIVAQDDTAPFVQYWQCKVDMTAGGIYEFIDLTDAGDGSGGHTDYMNGGGYGRKCTLIYMDGRNGNIFTRGGSVSGISDHLSFTAAPDGSSFTIRYVEDETSTAWFHSSYNDGDITLTPGDLLTTAEVVIRPPTNEGTNWDWYLGSRNVSEHGVSAKTWAGQIIRTYIHSGIVKTLDYENTRANGLWDAANPMSFGRFTIDDNSSLGLTQGRQFTLDYRYDMDGYAGGGGVSTNDWAGFDYINYASPYNLTSNYALEPGDSRADYGQLRIDIAEPVVGAAPTADAGADQSFIIHDLSLQAVTLDASGSSDSDGSIVSYIWTNPAGEIVTTGVNPTINLAEGTHVLTLKIEDNDGNVAYDEMIVDVVFEWDYTLYDAWPGRDETDPNQLVNLYESGVSCPNVTDLSWPVSAGDAELCLYEDDKFAAASLTVDDNTAPNHQFWIDQSNLYGFDVTWFIIVGSHRLNSGNAYFGTWEVFSDLYNLGFDVQSHTISHSSNDGEKPDADVHWEYSYSRALINENIADGHCLTLAYPYGSGRPDIAAQYFIAARGVLGGLNSPASTASNIMNTRKGNFSNVADIATPQGAYPRYWLNCLWHLINDEPAQAAEFASLTEYYDDIWFGSFADVAKYLQEYYTATLTVDSADETTGIEMTLTDRMFDGAFDYPLTVKVKLWSSWTQCIATQNGQPVDCEIISYEGDNYALVKAVPDRGAVALTNGPQQIAGDVDSDGDVDIYDFLILRSNYGTQIGATKADGDCDNDGDIDIYDFLILRSNYGFGN